MDYRAMNESCQCPRCRCEIRLPNQPMPCQQKCFPEKYVMRGSEQRPSWQKRSDPQEVFQNFSQRNPQTLSRESAQIWSFQPPPNCFCGQQPPSRAQPNYSQQFSKEYSQQFLPSPTQQCTQQSPCISCCGQQNRQNCFQPPCANWLRPCCVTHEVGVQTDEVECDIEIKPEYIAITDFTTKEVEVKHRTGKTETIIETVQSVTHFPVTETQYLRDTDKAIEDDVVPNGVPNRAMRNSELQPMLESIRAKVPKSERKSTMEELVYHEYAKSERDFNDPKATVEKTILKDLPEPQSKSRPPSYTPPSSRQPSGDTSQPRSVNDEPKATVGKTMFKDKSPVDSPDSPQSKSRSSSYIQPPSRLHNEDQSQAPLPRAISSISQEDPPLVKDEDESSDSSSTDIDAHEHKDSIEKEKIVVPAGSDIVSTVHVKVTNRKEASVKQHHDREPKKTAIFESSVSQVLIKKKPEEKKPEEKKPEVKKPEEKKPKRPPPKVEVKLGYPPNDLVCRYANPPVCRPTSGSTRCPRPQSISCNKCPSCPPCPPSTRQCDPIYGFGSTCVGYYCL
ncbi:proteoglycan 4 isoform X1 [Drosophila santomea]|uniref:proteoglycan 4 isoform X1 n=1 Tax=Drosophila santomea TaxID=129105 RepID=UPI001953D2E3|nr:proteoglycan 4 isoform X1 [Drosophila santomea]